MKTSIFPTVWLRRILITVLNAGAFLAFYALASTTIDLFGPFPSVPILSEKWTYLQEHRKELDVLFVGSSRVYRQIIPKRFDSIMSAGGVPVQSFNFGGDGLWPPESLYLLRKILRVPMPRLKWVFIELMDLRTDFKLYENLHSARLTYWHDTRHTGLAMRDTLNAPVPVGDKAFRLWTHFRLWTQQTSHIGIGTSLLKSALWPAMINTPVKVLAQDGFSEMQKEELTTDERTEFFSRLAARKAELLPVPTRPSFLRELQKIADLVHAAGAEPVFFISPTLSASENLADVPAGTRLLAFNQPAIYPQLLAPEQFADRTHLNRQGAALYTDLLAHRFLETLPLAQKHSR